MNPTFGKRLRMLREQKGLKQEDVAKVIGVTPEAIGNYENGKRMPRGDALTRLADFFNVSVDYLLGRTDDPRTLKDKIFDPTYTPTEVDLEELLEVANIRFMGERMAREDREKLLQIAKIIWEERRKIRERKGK